jgi:hypothetical protein
MRGLTVMAALLLAGCASSTWERPGLDPAAAERARTIDSAECTVAAMQAVPMPNPPAQASSASPAEYSVSGTTTYYGPNGEITTGYVNGTATVHGGYDQEHGLIGGQYFAESLNAEAARQKLGAACMLRRGWVKVKAGHEPVAAPAIAQTVAPASAYVGPGSASASSQAPLPLDPPSLSAARYSQWSKTQGH